MSPLRVFLIRKDTLQNVKKINIDEIMFYLKSQYSTDNRDQIPFIESIPSRRDVPSFEKNIRRNEIYFKAYERSPN